MYTRVTQLTYDSQSRQTSQTLPLGVAAGSGFVETRHYNDRSLDEATDPSQGNENPAQSVAMGQLEYEVSFEGVVTAYRYDNSTGGEGRLAAKYYYGGPTGESDYLADAGGGLLTEADDVVTYTYDAHGRQTSSSSTSLIALFK